MWSGLDRIDIKIDNIKQFGDSPRTSYYQSTQNDWPGKKIFPINDQDYVEKDWLFGCSFLNRDDALIKTKLFGQFNYHQNRQQMIQGLLIKMISLQSVLKQMGIPYLFSYYMDYETELQNCSELYAMLDKTNIYNVQNIYNIAKTHNWYDTDDSHPGIDAHQEWARLIQPYIK
jgi:hypothetical protein